MKKFSSCTAIVLMALSLSGCLAGRYMSDYALKPTPHGVEDIERTRHKADSLLPGSTAWYDGLKARGILKDITIIGHNDKKIHACYVPAARPEEAGGTAIRRNRRAGSRAAPDVASPPSHSCRSIDRPCLRGMSSAGT